MTSQLVYFFTNEVVSISENLFSFALGIRNNKRYVVSAKLHDFFSEPSLQIKALREALKNDRAQVREMWSNGMLAADVGGNLDFVFSPEFEDCADLVEDDPRLFHMFNLRAHFDECIKEDCLRRKGSTIPLNCRCYLCLRVGLFLFFLVPERNRI